MGTPSEPRLSYEESCRKLQELGWLDLGAIPPVPASRPYYEDNVPQGVSFFKMQLLDLLLENMTMPRTFFGRAEINRVSFKNTDLAGSTLCWNDFVSVNFIESDLSDSDLRASIFDGVDFTRANLSNADLRLSTFENCNFVDASLRGAKLARCQHGQLSLSARQQAEVDWQEEEGEEPAGG